MADNVLNIDGQQYKETDLSDKQIKEFSEYNHEEYNLKDYESFISFLYFSFIFEKDLDY